MTILLCLSSFEAKAHGDIHEIIDSLTAEIKRHPDSADLYLQRGVLYNEHGDNEKAIADFQKVKELNADNATADLMIARSLAEEGHFGSALGFVNGYLEHDPENVVALKCRAFVWQGLEKDSLAVSDLVRAMDHNKMKRPEHFLELSNAVLRWDSTKTKEAIGWLDKGIAEIGEVITLVSAAVAFEVADEQYEAALQRIEKIRGTNARHESWTIEAAKVYVMMNDDENAEKYYRTALDEIEALPLHIQNSDLVKNEKEFIGTELKRIADPR